MWVRKTRLHIQNISVIWYVYLWVYACISRGSKSEHSHGHKHMWSFSTWVHLWVFACISRGSKCEPSQGHKHMWVFSTWVHLQTYLRYDIYLITCEYIRVYQEVLSVSTPKSINICELEPHGFLYERICNMIYIYI